MKILSVVLLLASLSACAQDLVIVADRKVGGQTMTEKKRSVIRQWQVKNDSTVKANTAYELHNTLRRQQDLNSQLGYTTEVLALQSDREDVGWVGHSGGLFEFRRANVRDHRSISPFESVAIYNTKSRKYLTGLQEKDRSGRGRDYQVWSSKPSYEWQITERQGADFALFNTKKRDHLIIAAETAARTLRWAVELPP